MLEDVKAEMETTAQSTFDEYVDALKRSLSVCSNGCSAHSVRCIDDKYSHGYIGLCKGT